eukprot:TRINITY_DN3804_c0_g1_i5.p1 TRINITY_DN3804_c0_g1~~TRINITY_DN3804_c0_g1_i5.p1  ORF type:complete len:325 (-),score=62.00 TRINITY_DN3804_c0_g1_i5:60-1034(-)
MKTVLLGALKEKKYTSEFKQHRKIGNGGFASVYKAENLLTKELVAVKKTKLCFKGVSRSNFKDELAKMLREATYLSKIHHENIIEYYESWIESEPTPKNKQQELKRNLFSNDTKSSQLNDDSFEYENDYENYFDQNPETDFQIEFSEEQNDIVNQLEDSELGIKSQQLDTNKDQPSSSYSRKKYYSQDDAVDQFKSIYIYLATELCKETLDDYIQRRNNTYFAAKKTMKEEQQLKLKQSQMQEALRITQEILKALSYIHEKCGLVHRDIKPSNIFLTKNGTVKLGDFGLCKEINSMKTMKPSPIISSSPIHSESTDYDLSLIHI